jgi:hypothetical protein
VSIDFDGIGARLLASAETLIPQWIPGGKWRGNEYVAGSVQGGAGSSFSVNKVTGLFADFAADVKGGDLVALFAAIHGLSQVDAARELEPDATPGKANGHAKPTAERPATPAPLDFPEIPSLNGLRPVATHAYFGPGEAGPLFIVARYKPDGAPKEIRPFTWRNGSWSFKHYPSPRPLYMLRDLIARPAAPVLVVEGEGCADVAFSVLAPSYCVTTWSGGANATSKTDFTPLHGRDVTIWPDADEPGRLAAAAIASKLQGKVASLRILNIPKTVPEGWDCADALLALVDLADFIGKHAVTVAAAVPDEAAKGPDPVEPKRITRAQPQRAEGDTVQPDGQVDESAFSQWERLGLARGGNGPPFPMEANVVSILAKHPNFAGKIWFDTFREEVRHTLNGDERPWIDSDSRVLLYWVQTALQLSKFTKRLIDEGVLMYATQHKKNSVIEWIESVPWDGTNRIEDWLADYMGAPNDAHHRAAGRNWLISMVARAVRPGCQVDHMLILEGVMGRGKSAILRALGEPWFATLNQRFGSKEFIESIQSNWLIELADLRALANADHLHILAEITNRDDRYRTPWDRLASNHPRRCVFAGSTERRLDYLHDTFGIRRFWSVSCNELDVEGLKIHRQQLFAEAMAQYKAGETWHVMPEQTEEEQLSRVQQDDYQERIESFIEGMEDVTALEVFEGVFVRRDDFGRMIGRTVMEDKDSKRVAKCLRALKWFPVQGKRNNHKVNLWRPIPGTRKLPKQGLIPLPPLPPQDDD